MTPCEVCSRPGNTRRVRVLSEDGRHHYERRSICKSCDIAVRKKPSASKRGRQRDRDVPAPSINEWIAALRRSWAITNDCFRCELSGFRLDLDSAHKPLSLSCDHDPPGSANFLVVAWLINDMKNDHERQEFYVNVVRLAEIVRDGKPNTRLADAYCDSFASLKHWRRTKAMPEALAASSPAGIA